MTPYRTRKVRILNGAHTMTVLAAHLYGLSTVKECMDDEVLSRYVRKGVLEEIIPTLDLPEEELLEFGEAGSFFFLALAVICMGSGAAFWLKNVHREFQS